MGPYLTADHADHRQFRQPPRPHGPPSARNLTQTPALAGGAALSQNKTRRRLYEAVLWFLCEVYFVPVTATELNRSAVLSS